MQQLTRAERGAAGVTLAIVITLVFGIMAFAVDIGLGRVQVRQDQTAADAAALGAARVLLEGGTRAEAAATAIRLTYENTRQSNGTADLATWTARWTACADPDRDSSVYVAPASSPVATACISFASDNSRVRVRMPGIDVGTTFARVIGFDSFQTTAAAEAFTQAGGSGGFALFGISETCSSWAVMVKGGTNVPEGSVHSNADLSLESPLTLPDGATYRTNIKNETGVPAFQASAVSDPLAHVGMADYRPGGKYAALAAATGVYHDFTGQVITSADVIANGDGIYYTDRSILLTSGIAYQATFVVDNPTLTTKSAFETNGTGYTLSYYPSDTFNPDKLLVYTNAPYAQVCKPGTSPTIHFNGSEGSFEGVIYAPNGGAQLNGSGSGTSILGAIVADTLLVDGTGNVVRNDGSFLPAVPVTALYR